MRVEDHGLLAPLAVIADPVRDCAAPEAERRERRAELLAAHAEAFLAGSRDLTVLFDLHGRRWAGTTGFPWTSTPGT